MSTVTTTTTEVQAKETGRDPMLDSGFSGSLRLSLHGSMSESTTSQPSSAAASALTMSESNHHLNKETRPRRDSGICQELGQMSLGSSQDESTTTEGAGIASGLREDAWEEHYEPDEDGDVQLHLAIASGFVEVVQALIRMAPHPDYLSIQNNAAYAPLHIAVLQNQPALVRRLVVAGARLDVRDKEGNTPLHLAARRGHLECGEALLKPISVEEIQMADLPQPTLYTQLPVDIIDLKNHNGEHCVHLAAMGGHVDFLRFLCWNNADINCADGRAGRSALHFAVGTRNLEVIRCLVETRPLGCGINVNQLDWYGHTAYQQALLNGMQDIASFLARAVSGCDLTPPSLQDLDSDEEDWRSSQILLDSSA